MVQREAGEGCVIVAFPFSDLVRTEEQKVLERKLALLMIQSVRATMPAATIVQLTDDLGTAPLPVDMVLRKKIDGMDWVPWLMEFVSELQGRVLFVDSDIIVQRDLTPMFDQDADVIVTSRGPKIIHGRNMPILLGVAASRTPSFWLGVRDRVVKMQTREDRGWWGSQVALAQMWEEQQAGKLPWKMAALPVSTYNYTPEFQNDAPADKWVLHYKGTKRKNWMLAKWGHMLEHAEAA